MHAYCIFVMYASNRVIVGVNQLGRGNDIFQTKNLMLIFIECLNWFQAYNIPEKKFRIG